MCDHRITPSGSDDDISRVSVSGNGGSLSVPNFAWVDLNQ